MAVAKLIGDSKDNDYKTIAQLIDTDNEYLEKKRIKVNLFKEWDLLSSQNG